jgi:hypothetical protein
MFDLRIYVEISYAIISVFPLLEGDRKKRPRPMGRGRKRGEGGKSSVDRCHLILWNRPSRAAIRCPNQCNYRFWID